MKNGVNAPSMAALYSCNIVTAVPRMPFNAAHDAGHIELNPTKNAVRPLRDLARNGEKDVFTPEQITELIKAAPSEDWNGAILCGYYTGLRLRDVADLEWSAVDLDTITITRDY